MKLLLKLNLILILVFLLALVLSGYFSYKLLFNNARGEVIQNAKVMMEAAFSVRKYTVNQIRPIIKLTPDAQLGKVFHPQSVPAYAATEAFSSLREKFPEYSYKEATLNPTNPRNRATGWETDLIKEFSNHPKKKEIIGDRQSSTGHSLFLTHPIRITNPACLVCHSAPERAPLAMRKLYGENNGFGWKEGEVVGVQLVTVPMTTALEKASQIWRTFMIVLTGVFLLVLLLLNILLSKFVIQPVKRMAVFANSVSMGNLDEAELSINGKDEIANLSQSFNRMSRSVKEAMNLLGD